MERIEILNRDSKFRVLNLILLFLIIDLTSPALTNAQPPNRIISLAPNLTEILFAMGLGDRIVAVTNFCDYPEEAKRKQKAGGIFNPSLEAVVSLRPDIVVMTTDGNPGEFEERVRSLGIKTCVFRAKRLHELPGGIRGLGAALGSEEKGDKLAGEIEEAIRRFRVSFRDSKPPSHNSPIEDFELTAQEPRSPNTKKKVLFIIWPEPLIVAGPGTAIDDVITLLGCENIASKANIPYPKYSVEEIIYQAPDVLFIGRGHGNMEVITQGLLERLSKVPAVKRGEVHYISDSIYRLGPRIVKGIDEMAGCLK